MWLERWRHTQARHAGRQRGWVEWATTPIPWDDWVWAMGSLCGLHQMPCSPEWLARECPPPATTSSTLTALRQLGFRAEVRQLPTRPDALATELNRARLPLLLRWGSPTPDEPALAPQEARHTLALLTQVIPPDPSGAEQRFIVFPAQQTQPLTLVMDQLLPLLEGTAWTTAPLVEPPPAADGESARPAPFGFGWFSTELLRHRTV